MNKDYDTHTHDAFLGRVDDCFLWPREGDGPLIVKNPSGLRPNLRGYAILPIEEYHRLERRPLQAGLPARSISVCSYDPEPPSEAPEDTPTGVALWITPGAQLLTRCGLRARIYATDVESGFPVHGALFTGGTWRVAVWTAEGRYFDSDTPHDHDLAKPVRHKKIFVLWGESGRLYFRGEPVEVLYGEPIIASSRVELIEGEFAAVSEGNEP